MQILAKYIYIDIKYISIFCIKYIGLSTGSWFVLSKVHEYSWGRVRSEITNRIGIFNLRVPTTAAQPTDCFPMCPWPCVRVVVVLHHR